MKLDDYDPQFDDDGLMPFPEDVVPMKWIGGIFLFLLLALIVAEAFV